MCPDPDGRRPRSQRLVEDDLDRGGGRAEDFEPHTMEQGPGAWEEAQHQASQLSPSPHLGQGGGGGTAETRPKEHAPAAQMCRSPGSDSDSLCQAHRLAAPRDRGRSLPPGSAKAHRVHGWVRPPDSRWGAPLSTPLRFGFGRPNPAPPAGAGGSGRLGPDSRKLGGRTAAS